MRFVTPAAAFLLSVLVAAPCGAVTVGVPENLAPWGFSSSSPADRQGVYPEITRALSEQSGVPVEIRFLPYGRMLKDVQSGAVDYAFGVISPTTAEAAPFAAVVAVVPMVAVARKGVTLQRLEDLRSVKEVGYLRGGSCGKDVDGDAGINRVTQDNYESAIRKLAAGRLDAWCSIKPGFDYALAEAKLGEQMGPQISYGQVQIGLQVTRAKEASEETKRLVTALDGLVKDGSTARIFARYVGQ